MASVSKPIKKIRKRIAGFLDRRPHRSFRLTRRRDAQRSLQLPGYIAFTMHVNRTLWQYRRTFILVGVVYALLIALLVGFGTQETYLALTTTLTETGAEAFEGGWGQIGQAALLFASLAGSGLTGTLTEAQQIYSALAVLLVWLVTVWLLRNLLAGHKVKVRDGIYNSAAPLVSSFLVALVFIVQLVPVGLAIIGYSAATASGLLAGGVEAMLFWIAAGLLTIMSLYWVTSTFFALIIVTLPGMYPMRALRTAGDMVVGRRIRILLRLLWMVLVVLVAWAIVLIPVILIDLWLKGAWPQLEWLPIVPITLLFVSTVTLIWAASYVYLLYRKVVDDDAKPA